MRTENSLKNTIWTILAFGVNLVVNFVARKFFIDLLGSEYNGLNSLFTSVISVLSIAELGIGTTIIFFLYKPLHHEDFELVKSLMVFYKKCYRIIAGVVLAIGLAIIPFLPIIIGEVNISVNIILTYSLFLIESVLSYLLSYKRSIIIAGQKERIIKFIHIATIVAMNTVQIILLYLTKNYYLFLIAKIIFTCLENIIIIRIANKIYPFIKEKSNPLPIAVRASLNKRIRAMFYHQIGGFIINGTDNIMISIIFGISTVGYYNNYFLIVSSIFSLISGIFSSITASIGNLLVVKNEKESIKTYSGIQTINYIIAAYISCAFYFCTQPFMRIWLGENYLMSNLVVGSLSVYLYFRMMKLTTGAFKNAAGIFYEDRFIPIVESIINIVFSLVFASTFGVAGIIMGTIISNFVLYFGSYPLIVYKKVFKTTPIYYYRQHLSYLVLTAIIWSLVLVISNYISTQNPLLDLAISIIMITIVFGGVVIMLRYMNPNFKQLFTHIIKKLFRIK